MNILIVGGTGFIGPHVVRGLVNKGHSVALFHRGQTAADLPAEVTHIYGKRQHLDDFASPFRAFSPEVILDMFAYTEQDVRLSMQVFTGLASRIICVSSMDVYRAYGRFRRLEIGTPDQQPFDEEAPLRGVLYPYRALSKERDDLLYNYEKILVEQAIMSEPRLPGTILRLPQVFGPNDKQHRLAAYLKSIDEDGDIILDEAKARWRWTRGYVEDVASAIVLAATDQRATERIYNVGEAQAQAEFDWIMRIGQIVGWRGKVKTVPRVELPEHLSEPYDWSHDLAANTNRIREELGFVETVPPEEALRRTIAWERAARQNRSADDRNRALERTSLASEPGSICDALRRPESSLSLHPLGGGRTSR